MEWPDEGDESAFLSEAGSRGESPLPAAAGTAAPVLGERLPPLGDLVARVPPEIRGILDDLFRAKFTGVRKFAPAPSPEAPP